MTGRAKQNEAELAKALDKALAGPCAGEIIPLIQAIYSAGICVLYQNKDLIYTQAENLPTPLRQAWRENCGEADLFPAPIAAQMAHLKRQILDGSPPIQLEVKLSDLPQEQAAAGAAGRGEAAGETARGEAAVRQPLNAEAEAAQHIAAENEHLARALSSRNLQTQQKSAAEEQEGQILWLRFCLDAHRNAQGEILGIITTGVNITELRTREEVLKVLLREVSHRSKNLLAIIQSIAAQTARFSHTIGGFLKKFQGRLQSLSSSQDLVTESDWRGALLQDLIAAQTHFYADSAAPENCSLQVEGENPYLFPSAALHIGLALHELIINSASFGALAKGEGSIKIACRPAGKMERTEYLSETEAEVEVEAEAEAEAEAALAGQGQETDAAAAGQNALMLSWWEEFPADKAVTAAESANEAEACQAHFGSIVLEKIVPVSVDGQAKYSIKNGNIEYSLKFPSSQFSYK